MPKCSAHCQYPQLPLDTSPHFCPLCRNRFHAICSQAKYVNANAQGLTFANSVMCPTCALLKLHLVIHVSPTQFESPEPAQRQEEGPGADEVLETQDIAHPSTLFVHQQAQLHHPINQQKAHHYPNLLHLVQPIQQDNLNQLTCCAELYIL